MWNGWPVQVWWMRQNAQGWCTGMTLRDEMGRDVGGGFRKGDTSTPTADLCQYMAKTTTILWWFFPYFHISLGCTCVPHPDPTSHLPPHPMPQGHPSAPALSILSHASNLDWWSISHVIIYMFQCYSPKSSNPHPLQQRPTVCSLYLCLFCCIACRIIVTIFLNSIYMR